MSQIHISRGLSEVCCVGPGWTGRFSLNTFYAIWHDYLMHLLFSAKVSCWLVAPSSSTLCSNRFSKWKIWWTLSEHFFSSRINFVGSSFEILQLSGGIKNFTEKGFYFTRSGDDTLLTPFHGMTVDVIHWLLGEWLQFEQHFKLEAIAFGEWKRLALQLPLDKWTISTV